jgi:hypothetical protein
MKGYAGSVCTLTNAPAQQCEWRAGRVTLTVLPTDDEKGLGGGRMGGGLLRRNSRALTKLNPCLDQSKGEERVNVRV